MLGRKSGSGFYKYEGRSQAPNESLAEWRRKLHGDPEGSDTKKALPTDAQEITERLVFLMVNEAARCLEEGVVGAPEDADYGMILGTGFAAYRGGPLRFAEHFGLKKLVEKMDALHASAGEGDKFVPCNLLRQHAQNGTKFYEDTARRAA
jgi:3-hydroxyacyl-CoA dehydrogenase/enoyl-CoA hydratase/3-hydroxybutyryl-CoA epimerase